MTEPDDRELISALLDREPVDPDRLAALLERPDARALLADFVRVRVLLRDDAEPAVSAAPAVGRRRPALPRAWLRIAAAMILVAAGVVAGQWLNSGNGDVPPEPTRVVRLSPATDGGAR